MERPKASSSSQPLGIMVRMIDFCHFKPQRKPDFLGEQQLKGKIRVPRKGLSGSGEGGGGYWYVCGFVHMIKFLF